jgi:hypothetical protein
LLAAGEYRATVQISSNGGASSVAISMLIEALPELPTPPAPENGVVNVRDYGAYGDGLHDDTRAFDAALAALGGAGGTLQVPAGIYLLKPKTGVPDRGLDLYQRSNIVIDGDGMDRSVLRLAPGSYVNAGDTHLIFLYRSANITFQDLAFDGNQQNATFLDEQNHCVEVWSSSDVIFDRVLFHNCYGDGIRLIGRPSSGMPWTDGVTIQDSRFENNGRSGIAVQRAVRDLRILRNVFQRIVDQSIDIEPTGSESPTDVLIEGNTVRHSTANYAIAIGGIGGGDVAQRFTVRNNRVENGSVMISKAHDVTVEGNVILGDPYHPAALRFSHDMSNVQVFDNQITSISTAEDAAGIQVVGLNDHYPQLVVVRDNVIVTKRAGIVIRDPSHGIAVQDNSITGVGGGSGVVVTMPVERGIVHTGISISRNLVRNFSISISLYTQSDLFSDVTITENNLDHNQTPSTATIGILFDKTGPYQSFAVVVPNVFGSGIKTPIAIRSN